MTRELGSSGAMTGAEATGKNTEVGSQMERAKLLSDQLWERLKTLEEQLTPILRLHVPVPETSENVPVRPTLVLVAQRISNYNDQIEAAIYLVENILTRLEL